MLNIQDLHKQYEGKPLLCGVSFRVGADETVCLLGKSGGGKSTILRIIAGLEQAESGEMFWNDQDITRVPAHLRNFGLMFQDYALFPHLNVFENVAFGLRVNTKGSEGLNQRVGQVLEMVGMGRFANRSVLDLSGGEKQRVAFARAIAPRPKMLMLDEPMGALDRTMRDQLLRDLRELLALADVPVIYVTHDQEEAFAIADRILVLHDGRIVQAGAPEVVFSGPNNLWVASFFGLNNRLPGVVISHNPLTVKTAMGVLRVACAEGGVRVGEAVDLLITDVSLGEDADLQTNSFSAWIKERRFLGRDFQLVLHIAEGLDFTVASDQALDVGQKVPISIDPAAILCYPTESSHENCQE